MQFSLVSFVSLIIGLSFFAFAPFAQAAINITFHPNSTCTAADDDTLDSGANACAKATGLGTDHIHHIEIFTPTNVLFAVSTSGTGNREAPFVPNACGVWTAKVIKDSDSSLQAERTFTIGNCAPTTATLIVIKHVINDNGGTAVAGDFILDSGGTNDTPDNFAGAESPGTSVTLDPGSYNVTETGPSGYAASFSADCSGTIAAGATKTCTVTNNDIQPLLTVTKVVVNNDGGTKQVSDFPLFVDATSVTSGTQSGFNSGTYTVSETTQSGYAATMGGDCAANGSITLAVGDVKSCTITNDDGAGSLTLEKIVVNDDGGTAVASDWTLTATGPTGFSGFGPSVTNGDVGAGTYDLSENGPAGYTASAWVCVGGNQIDSDTVEVSVGDTVTCTIINDDNTRPPPPPPPHDDGDQCRVDIVITNDGSINSSTWSISRTGGNSAGGSYGGDGGGAGDGGRGGNAKSEGGTSSGGSGGAGGDANGGNGGKGGFVETGDATSDSGTVNSLNRTKVFIRR